MQANCPSCRIGTRSIHQYGTFAKINSIRGSQEVYPRVTRWRRQRGHHGAVCAQQLSGNTIFPPYTLVSKQTDYDLRFFDAYPVIRMAYERRDEGAARAAFQSGQVPAVSPRPAVYCQDSDGHQDEEPERKGRLTDRSSDAGYIGLGAYFDGENSQGVRLRQTQPVVMRFNPEGSKTMELYIGCQQDGQSLEALPQPKDGRLSLEVAGGEVAAVLKFEGNATREATLRAVAKLKTVLASDGLKLAVEEAAGTFRLAQYGPLNSLSTRVNEVLLRVLL